ncbi:hypothetical protein [Alloalcanivorax xenomutans]|uniref:hypothetical protein n=1 Tax=Alloalcanivorax xenomutans TaxID=1094342 RepID=UPI001F3E3468|nr:hypothetical protein [Alloalcanivorax xenomutans]MCE7521948.1 hypothetical protein [Alloalcanivorax xenomutans]
MAKLTTRGLRIDSGGTGGGPVTIAAEDVAGALGMGRLKPQAVLVGRATFCDDNRAQLELAKWVQQELHRRCRRNGWKTDYCEGLAQLCVFELVHPLRCVHCLGRGQLWLQVPERRGERIVLVERWRTCPRCKGSGRKRLTVRDRAAVAQIGKSQFADVWAERADAMLSDLYGLQDDVLRHLWKQFADEAA